jgi:2-C-methyl-D-erythritol 2,4-cyclodiphosphate synthase
VGLWRQRRLAVLADIRAGVGYDIHRLTAGRQLVIGGIQVPFSRGSEGHSDGDVLLHAVADALLGACTLPDIGELFPDTDPSYNNADSRDLLRQVLVRVHEAGFTPRNVDCIVHAEKPKLSEHKRPMAEMIASLLAIEPSCVSVKAKTAEGVGPIGEGQAIAATVVVTVERV